MQDSKTRTVYKVFVIIDLYKQRNRPNRSDHKFTRSRRCNINNILWPWVGRRDKLEQYIAQEVNKWSGKRKESQNNSFKIKS